MIITNRSKACPGMNEVGDSGAMGTPFPVADASCPKKTVAVKLKIDVSVFAHNNILSNAVLLGKGVCVERRNIYLPVLPILSDFFICNVRHAARG